MVGDVVVGQSDVGHLQGRTGPRTRAGNSSPVAYRCAGVPPVGTHDAREIYQDALRLLQCKGRQGIGGGSHGRMVKQEQEEK